MSTWPHALPVDSPGTRLYQQRAGPRGGRKYERVVLAEEVDASEPLRREGEGPQNANLRAASIHEKHVRDDAMRALGLPGLRVSDVRLIELLLGALIEARGEHHG